MKFFTDINMAMPWVLQCPLSWLTSTWRRWRRGLRTPSQKPATGLDMFRCEEAFWMRDKTSSNKIRSPVVSFETFQDQDDLDD